MRSLQKGLLLFFIVVGLVGEVLGGCAQTKALTPGQIAATQPASHVFNNINQALYHSQQALEVINIPAFLAGLVGVGLLVYGAITADSALEHIGILVSVIAGAVTLGTLAGIFALPFTPWVLLIGFLGGVGYGAYLLVHKYLSPKPTVPPVSSVPVVPPPEAKS
jgi:hypothetical protein